MMTQQLNTLEDYYVQVVNLSNVHQCVGYMICHSVLLLVILLTCPCWSTTFVYKHLWTSHVSSLQIILLLR